MIRRQPRSTLCPCTTRFRSEISIGESGRAKGEPPLVSADVIVRRRSRRSRPASPRLAPAAQLRGPWALRSEEHTSELQSRQYLVCRLLLEKKIKSSLARTTE